MAIRRPAWHGDLDGLRERAATGDPETVWRLVELLAEHGDLDGLQERNRTNRITESA